MQYVSNQGVADYLNNKFGDDFATTEPWMKRHRTDTAYKCRCEAMDDLMMECLNEEDEDYKEKNLVGFIRLEVVSDDEAEGNLIKIVYEKVQ